MKYPLLDKSGFLHGIATPTTVYALFEQAIRRRRGATVDDHLRDISSLFSGFSHVAAAHPRDSWFPTAYTADELATVTAANRAVTWPGYPKRLNAIMKVDQAAAVVLCSVRWARAHGIPPDKWVYLHGCADIYDVPTLMRRDLDKSPGMAVASAKAFAMARKLSPVGSSLNMDHMQHLDVCVQPPVSCAENCGVVLSPSNRNEIPRCIPSFPFVVVRFSRQQTFWE
eukprot:m.997586 g.997586  ORF g.997586 m.997586 type:complete len:226 (+) comp24022_c1_seq22:353-1030(+)